jgi:hypothetical protein
VIEPTAMIVPIAGLAANGLLGAGSYGIAAAALRQPRGLPRWLAAAVVFWTASTIGMELLGSVGAIGTYTILIGSALVGGIGMATWWIRGDDPAELKRLDDGPAGWEGIISLAMVLAASLLFAIPSLFAAVKVVSDGPIYHLYFAARWWKAGRLILVAAPFGENAATYFPANGDLWFTWLMATWGGDTLAKVGQAPFLLLAGAAAFGCARLLGCGRPAATIATCWFVSCTPLLLYSFEPNVDTIFVAGYLAAAYFFLRYAVANGGTPALVLGALVAGEALATKPTGVVFVTPLLALVVGGLLIQGGSRPEKLWRIAIVALVPLLTGGFWFLRNAWLTGNPLYPLDVRVMGRTLWAGWYGPEAMRTSPYYLPLNQWRALTDIVVALLDPRLAPVWLVSIAGAWVVANARTWPVSPWIELFALSAVVNVALYWVVIPYRTQQRFMLQALGLAVVPLSATLDRSRWLRIGATALLGLHILTPQAWPFADREGAIPWDLSPQVPNAIGSLIGLFPGIAPGNDPARSTQSLFTVRWIILALLLAAILMVWAWQRAWAVAVRRSGWSWWRFMAICATLAFLGLGSAEAGRRSFDPMFRFYPPFRDFYPGWRAFDAACGPRGARVAYAGTNIPYYLLGQGLRNEVRYVNVDRHRDWLLHDYHREALTRGQGSWPNSRPGWDRLQPDYRAWLDNLDAESIQLLVVTRVNPAEGAHNVADTDGFPIERRWADSHPERFVRLYGQDERDPWFRLYRVIRRRSDEFSGSRTDRTAGRHS